MPWTWFQRRSLSTQLAWVMALVVGMLVCLLILVLTSMMRAQIERDKGAALSAMGRSVAMALGKNLRDRMQQIDLLIATDELWAKGLDSSEVSRALERTSRSRPTSSWIGVADEHGTVVAAAGGLLLGRSVSERPWFAAGLSGKFVGDVHHAKLLAGLLSPATDGGPPRFVDFAAPIRVKDKVVGVLALHGDVQSVQAIAGAFLPKNAVARQLEVYVLTKQGEVIFGPDREARIGAIELETALAANATVVGPEQGRPAFDVVWADGRRYLTSAWRLEDFATDIPLGWRVLVRQPVEVAYAPARRAAERALMAGAGLGICVIGLAWVLGHRLTKPLQRIADAAREAEQGAAGADIPRLNQSRELSQLSNSLQSMTARLEGLVADRTAQLNNANDALRALSDEQSAMLDNQLVGIVRLDMKTRQAIWHNRAMAGIFGYAMDELQGRPARMLYADDETYEFVGRESREAFAEGRNYVARVKMARKDGQPIWIHLQGSLLHVKSDESLWMMTDVTAQHQYQEHVERMAYHDGLTGLPNRLLLADRLNQVIANATRSGQIAAVAYLDLDGFKAVNDQHGHAAGDTLLKAVALRLTQCVRAGDTVARLGGDEFVLVLSPLIDQVTCQLVLERVLAAIEQAVEVAPDVLAFVSGSIGVALFPSNASDSTSLLAAADRAMYTAKQEGKGCISYAASQPNG